MKHSKDDENNNKQTNTVVPQQTYSFLFWDVGEALQSQENIIEELVSIECCLCNRSCNVHFLQSNHHSSPMSYMLLSSPFY